MRTYATSPIRYFHIPSYKQIETFEGLINEINTLITEAKASAKYNEFDHLIERALSGVLICNDGYSTMVETARKSGDRAIYSITIKMLIRAKESVKNIIDSYRN